MVFQDPNNQFVSSVIEEDISFGLENFDTPDNGNPRKGCKALALVGMDGFEEIPQLSGGQKQRIAIAGVMAVDPDILLMKPQPCLTPEGRQEVLSTIQGFTLRRVRRSL